MVCINFSMDNLYCIEAYKPHPNYQVASLMQYRHIWIFFLVKQLINVFLLQ